MQIYRPPTQGANSAEDSTASSGYRLQVVASFPDLSSSAWPLHMDRFDNPWRRASFADASVNAQQRYDKVDVNFKDEMGEVHKFRVHSVCNHSRLLQQYFTQPFSDCIVYIDSCDSIYSDYSWKANSRTTKLVLVFYCHLHPHHHCVPSYLSYLVKCTSRHCTPPNWPILALTPVFLYTCMSSPNLRRHRLWL